MRGDMTQRLLFPDPRPLVDRLGRKFFRQLPESPGVYLMRDAADTVLYVGKAKNLRKRLGSYRVANPDRMPRRHLRLLRAVARIELQESADEPAALAREAELLRSLRPRFNRAGTWPAPPRFLGWRIVGQGLEVAIAGSAPDQWHAHGPLGAGAFVLRAVLVRLLWFALCPEVGLPGMPAGWVHGRFGEEVIIPCGTRAGEVSGIIESLFGSEPSTFCEWIRGSMGTNLHPFAEAVVERDLEYMSELFLASPTM